MAMPMLCWYDFVCVSAFPDRFHSQTATMRASQGGERRDLEDPKSQRQEKDPWAVHPPEVHNKSYQTTSLWKEYERVANTPRSLCRRT